MQPLTSQELIDGLRESNPMLGRGPIHTILEQGAVEDFVKNGAGVGVSWEEISMTAPSEALALGIAIGVNAIRNRAGFKDDLIESQQDADAVSGEAPGVGIPFADTESPTASDPFSEPETEQPGPGNPDGGRTLTPWGDSFDSSTDLNDLPIPREIEDLLGGPEAAREAINNAQKIEILPGMTLMSLPLDFEKLRQQ